MYDSNLPSLKQKYQQLQEKKAFLQQIADLTPELLFVIDIENQEIIYINKKAEQFLNIGADCIYEQGFEIFSAALHPDDYHRRMKNLEICRQLPDHKESEVEVRLKSANGNWNWFRIRDKVFKRNHDGSVSHIIGVAQNIHEQKIADEKLYNAYQELKRSSTTIRQMLNGSIAGIIIFESLRDEQGKIIDFIYRGGNKAAEEILGKSIEDVQGKRLLELWPGVKNIFFDTYVKVVETDEPLQEENYYPYDGFDHWFNVTAVKNGDGFIMTFLNVTDRKKTETELEENKVLLQTVFDTATVDINVLKCIYKEGEIQDFEFLLVNKSAINRIGFNPISHYFSKVIPEELQSVLINNFYTVLRTGQAWSGEVYYRRDNRWFFLSASTVRDLLIIVIQDITEHKQAEQEIIRVKEELVRQATGKYRSLFNSIDEGFGISEVIFLEDSGKIDVRWLEVNPRFEELTGLSREELLSGKTTRQVIPDLEEPWFEVFRQVALTGEPMRFEQNSPSLNRWFDVYAFCTGEPEQHQVAMLFNNITERKNNEIALLKAKEEAEKAARAKKDFVSTMSHEIRTPLNVVIGLANLLLEQDPREDQKENLSTLHFSANNLLALINDILDFSKIEAGKVELAENEFNLHELIKSLKKAHQPKANENNIQLKVSLDENVPQWIVADQLKLSQILHNLVSNAVKFTHQGQVIIEVKAKRQEGERVWLDFAVRDTGIGIAPDKLDHIFKKFTQADSSTVRNYGGTGLGLTITKMLLEIFGSEIKVQSKVGDGSCFFFDLPVKAKSKEHVKGCIPDQPKEVKNLQHINLLLVDDVKINRKIIKQFLQKWWQLQPDEAANGKEAIAKARGKHYDIILMDLRMPEMDGHEAARYIRSLAEYKNIPILALTAEKEQEVEKKPETYFNDIIIKPFNPMDLHRKILQHLSVSAEKQLEASAKKLNLLKIRRQFEESIEDTKELYSVSFRHLQEFKELFKEAMEKGDEIKLRSLNHKATTLLSLLELEELATLLGRSKKLLAENADEEEVTEVMRRGEALFDQAIRDIQTRYDV